VIRHLAQLELAALVAVLDQLGKGVRQTTGADVVNEFDRILVRHGPAAVDHFLAAALHLWVLPLHGGEIQILGGGAAGHRRSGAAAEPDQHGGAAQHNQLAPRCKRLLLDMLGFDVAVAAGNHDWLVIAAALDAVGARRVVFVTAEITADVRATVFIVEGGAANGTLDHDVERGDDAIRLAVVVFPRLREIRNLQIRHAETGEADFRLGTAPHRALIANLATGAGAGTGERRNRGGVIVGLDFHQQMNVFVVIAISEVLRVGIETPAAAADDDSGVIGIRAQHTVIRAVGAALPIRVLDHLEQ